MIDKKLLTALKQGYTESESQRRQINSAANNILFEAKKTIFALQREESGAANKKLAAIESSLAELENRFGAARLRQEGSFRAATEEYLEARTLRDIIKDGKVRPAKLACLDHESYLGGICDMVGELVRFATNRAAAGNFNDVSRIKKMAEEVMSQLIDFDMTGYLRTKYDQARGHLRKLEQMAYEIRLRGKK